MPWPCCVEGGEEDGVLGKETEAAGRLSRERRGLRKQRRLQPRTGNLDSALPHCPPHSISHALPTMARRKTEARRVSGNGMRNDKPLLAPASQIPNPEYNAGTLPWENSSTPRHVSALKVPVWVVTSLCFGERRRVRGGGTEIFQKNLQSILPRKPNKSAQSCSTQVTPKYQPKFSQSPPLPPNSIFFLPPGRTLPPTLILVDLPLLISTTTLHSPHPPKKPPKPQISFLC